MSRREMTGSTAAWSCAVVVAACVSMLGCASATSGRDCPPFHLPADQLGRVTIAQGIAGNVWEWVGDFSSRSGCGTVTAVARTILVYPLTPAAALPGLPGDAYWSNTFPGSPIDSVRSDSAGFMQITLLPGSYSLVMRDGARYYVRIPTLSYDAIGRVDVTVGAVSRIAVTINDRASF